MSLVKDGLAKSWAETLTIAAGFPFFPHRHDGKTAPPFGVVLVKQLRPTVPEDDAHEADVRVVVVTDAAETPAANHRVLVGKAYAGIQATPRKAIDVANGVQLFGFMITEIEQASGTDDDGKMIHSDVFSIVAGAGAAG